MKGEFMKKTNKFIMAIMGTILAGSIVGCDSEERVVFEQPSQPPHVEGYDDRYWHWDEDDGEWEYNPPGGGAGWYFYNGGLFRKSIKSSGLKSSAVMKTMSSGKIGGFGSSYSGFGG
jgi:hypothetical protein